MLARFCIELFDPDERVHKIEKYNVGNALSMMSDDYEGLAKIFSAKGNTVTLIWGGGSDEN